jgi:pyrroline-5-carboxylate reductase
MKAATIAIIGGGNMGASLAGGLIKDGYSPAKIWMTDLAQDKLDYLRQHLSVHTTVDNLAAVKNADIIILAVKPQILHTVSKELAATVQARKPLIISIAAGIRIASIEHWLGDNLAIVRSMPNTPALVGCGATALFANKHTSVDQRDNAESILRAVGLAVWVADEKMMDAVTALSGSGPAYFFLMMEAMQQAGEELGLPKDTARLLTLQTALGAARMALESEKPAAELRRNVTSPGGTTEQGVRVLEEANIRKIFMDTLHAAQQRSEELAKLFDAMES